MSKKKMKEDLGEKNPKIENPVGNELHKKKDDYEEKWLNVRLKFLSFLAKMLEFKQTHKKAKTSFTDYDNAKNEKTKNFKTPQCFLFLRI